MGFEIAVILAFVAVALMFAAYDNWRWQQRRAALAMLALGAFVALGALNFARLGDTFPSWSAHANDNNRDASWKCANPGRGATLCLRSPEKTKPEPVKRRPRPLRAPGSHSGFLLSFLRYPPADRGRRKAFGLIASAIIAWWDEANDWGPVQ